MLGKLFKYEIKSTARQFLSIFTSLIGLALILKLFNILSTKLDIMLVPNALFMFLYVVTIIGMFIATVIIAIQRFYKNLLTDEGYLMFTLPTKTWKHIVSKLIVSMMWTAISGIVTVTSILIVAYTRFFVDELPRFFESISKFFESFGASSVLFTVEFLLGAIISLASTVLIIYASIAVGHLFSRHRILASLGAFIVINTVTQTIFTIAGIIGGSIPIFRQIGKQDNFAMDPLFHVVIWLVIIFTGLISAGYFILTNYILSRHLNLE
jgi:hypothetical protein